MKAAVRRLYAPVSPRLEYADVVAVSGKNITVIIDGDVYTARTAASCLLKPSPGDTALVSLGSDGNSFVLSVLERADAENSETELSLDGDVSLNVRNGAFIIRADDGIQLATRKDFSLLAGRVELNAGEAKASLENVKFSGRLLECSFESIRRLAAKCEDIFGRLSQKCGSSTKMVEGHDEVQAGSMRRVTDGTMSMQSRNMIQTAEENVRIDAEKIHLG